MDDKIAYSDILSHICERDSLGIEALYRQYANQMRGYAISKWELDEDSAWDVVYQTLEALVLKLPRYEFKDQAHFDRLVFKFFLNFLRQHHRKNRFAREIKWESITETTAAEIADEDSEVNTEKLISAITDFYDADEGESTNLEKLEECLQMLDPLERDLLLLRARGYSYEEMARMLKIDNSHLNVKRFRAEQKLIKLFNQ
ncbi:RNA polymerase sigma factor [Salmonirosea aquatica]|uniref:Sigma-70 family RNA polymerase sigma factor n=1 Tax=Salmonirosea aquatica TaxID=2654236 RepID=A0A7C9FXZ0_9BACT|nr:sigma-70 family RNA polymerase sigma factor [Cytophagaceae bacterium SJW1-29]